VRSRQLNALLVMGLTGGLAADLPALRPIPVAGIGTRIRLAPRPVFECRLARSGRAGQALDYHFVGQGEKPEKSPRVRLTRTRSRPSILSHRRKLLNNFRKRRDPKTKHEHLVLRELSAANDERAALRLRHLGKDVIAGGRKPLPRLGLIAFGQGEPHPLGRPFE
jgi:hypothetical protein